MSDSKKLYGMIQGNLGLIFIQIILGDYISIYLPLIKDQSLLSYISSYPLIALHSLLGFIIFILGIALLVSSIRIGGRILLGNTFAMIGIIISVLGGLGYLSMQLNNNLSFLMGIGSIIAIAGYVSSIIGAVQNMKE